MRAQRLVHGGPAESMPLEACDLPVPEPGPGEVRVRVTACGICRTDLHVIEEDLPAVRRPIVPGHQVVGVVDSLGPGVEGLSVGARVGVAWLQGTCGTCRYCTSERENLCEQPRFTGYHVDGGFAEFTVARADWVYALPDGFSDVDAAPLLCAGIIGYRALRLSEVEPGQKLGLYGFGASAHIVIQLALHRGCEVYVCSLRERHRALARDLGACWTGEAAALPPNHLDGSILFAPAGELVLPALRGLARGGTLACAGIHMSPIPSIDYDELLFGERTLRSVTANTRRDAREFMAEAARIPVRTHTNLYSLEDAGRALADLKAGSFDGAGVLTVAGS